MTSIATKLFDMGACYGAWMWAGEFGSDEMRAWQECQRGDWMLWLVGKQAGPPESDGRKKLVLCACDCVSLALKYTEDPRVKDCIDTARRWAKGEATIEELRKAREDAYAALYVADVVTCATYVAYAATYAAYIADADADDAAVHATYVATHAADAIYVAANADTTMTKILSQCADIVRQHYPVPPVVD